MVDHTPINHDLETNFYLLHQLMANVHNFEFLYFTKDFVLITKMKLCICGTSSSTVLCEHSLIGTTPDHAYDEDLTVSVKIMEHHCFLSSVYDETEDLTVSFKIMEHHHHCFLSTV